MGLYAQVRTRAGVFLQEPCLGRAFRVKRLFPYIALALLTLVLWGRTVRYEFVWDDQYFIVANESLTSLTNIPRYFRDISTQAAAGWAEEFKVFRPLRNVHYALLTAVGGGEPRPWLFHLANVLWHTASVLLLYAVCRRLFGDIRAAFIAALGFAVHPVLSEAICWVKCFDDIMAAAFVLGSTLLLITGSSIWSLGGAVALFTFAVYAKVSAVPFAALATLILFRQERISLSTRSLPRALLRSAPFFLIALAYMAHRHLVIGQSNQVAPLSGSYGQTLVDMLPAFATYARLVLGIPPFRIDYAFMKGGHRIYEPMSLLGLVLVIAVAVGALAMGAMARRELRRNGTGAIERHDEAHVPENDISQGNGKGAAYTCASVAGGYSAVSLGLGWFGLFMLPVSNLVPMMQYMAERFLYLPLAGLLIAGGGVLAIVRRRAVYAVICVVIVTWASITWQRCPIWRDRMTLFITSALQGPISDRLERNAVKAALAQPHMLVALQGKPTPEEFRKVLPSAVRTLDTLADLFPFSHQVVNAQGVLAARLGDHGRALDFFEQAIALSPETPAYRANKERSLQKLGRLENEPD